MAAIASSVGSCGLVIGNPNQVCAKSMTILPSCSPCTRIATRNVHVISQRNSCFVYHSETRIRGSGGRKGRKSVIMQAGESKREDVDQQIGQYCDISAKGSQGPKKSVGEMEQEFLLALQSFYMDCDPIMSNEEFDNLKEELLWEGSKVVILSPEEQKFMEASLAYQAGKPFLNDTEFDTLKGALKKQGSKVAIEGPRCSIRSRRVYSDSQVDYIRMTLLNVPAVLIALGLVFFLDDVTGFEITYLLELPEPYSFLFTWFIVLPATFLVAQSLTNLAIKDFLILRGPCPSCGSTNVSFFGTILSISNTARTNDVKCDSCGSTVKFDLDSRRITLESAKPPPQDMSTKAEQLLMARSQLSQS